MSEANGFAGRDLFLAPPVRRYNVVDIEGFGKVRIRSLNELERSRYEASALDKKGQVSPTKIVDLKCRLIVLSVVDADGNPLFTNSDIPQLQRQDSRITNILTDAIRSHCGITPEDVDDLEKKVETPVTSSP